MSGSGSPSPNFPFPPHLTRARTSSTASAVDARLAQARGVPRGRDRLSIDFLASGGEQPQPGSIRPAPAVNPQAYTRTRTTSNVDISQARRLFPTGASPLSQGQASVAMAEARLASVGRTYRLEVVQHPEKSAEFGSATLSRLPLAPALIVQLRVRDQSGASIKADDELYSLVCHLSLHSEDGSAVLDVPSAPGRPRTSQQLLYGNLVSSPHNYRNLQGRIGHYFVFPDVSIRRRGRYRLKVTLMRVPGIPGTRPQTGDLASAWTNPFDILSPTNYVAPPLTALTQYFIQQGARMYAFAPSPYPPTFI